MTGDTVFDVALRHDVDPDQVIALNGLSAPYSLRRGQLLRIPVPDEHIVASGESLSAIAAAHGVDQADLAAANGLTIPYTIQPGQRLRLPARRNPIILTAEHYQVVSSSQAPAQSASARPMALTQGEDIGFEAPPSPGSSAVTVETLAPLPAQPQSAADAAPPRQPGQPLALVPSAVSPTVEAPARVPLAIEPAPQTPAQASPAPPTPAQPLPAPSGLSLGPAPGSPVSPPSQTAALPPPAVADPPAAAAGPPPRGDRFGWPIVGTVISGFGPKPDGTHNDGINISAARGASVTAAADGVVAYAGNELRGYGNLLLVRHEGDWVTAYAHLDELLVQRGETVRYGQPIATVGASGTVNAPQLHFEIRRGTEAVDPGGFLPPLSR